MWLDGPSYPHVLHNIVAHADPCTQLALRATCRGVRNMVDRKLFKHVMFGSIRGGFALTARSIKAGVVCYAAPDFDGGDSFTDTDTAATLALLAPAKIVYVYATMGLVFLPWFRNHHPKDVVLRSFGYRHEYYAGTFTGPKLVVFRHLVSQDEIRTGWLMTAISPTVRTLVINIKFDMALDPRIPHDGPDGNARIPDLTYVDELVIVFAPYGRRCPFPRAKKNGEYPAFFNIYHLVAQDINRARKTTIVGMEAVDCRWFGSPKRLDGDELVERSRENINFLAAERYLRTKGVPKPSKEVSKFNSLLKFMTLDEYRAAVGDEEFAVNTVA